MQNMVRERLFKNNFTYKKPDSLTERISNMASWLLSAEKIKPATTIQRLKKEMEEMTTTTNKNQRSVLQDLALVKGICCLTQLDYFRHELQLDTGDLKTSRTFATPVRMILIVFSSDDFLTGYSDNHAIGDGFC